MGHRSDYAPGLFCWADLGTTDAAGARAFYAELLGWEPDPARSAPDPDEYAVMAIDGAAVAGVYLQDEDQRARGVPPAWLSYVAVEDADATAARAQELGGALLMGPKDVAEDGRMALIGDPQGAVFALWQGRRFAGAELVNDAGAMTINQLNTTDPAGAEAFYSELFGWEFAQVGTDAAPFWSIANDGRLNGGMMALQPQAPAPPHWLVYFTVEDLDASAGVLAARGGAVVVPPMQVPAGRFLVAHDPQYAFFALFEGAVDP
ncbi:VOC family protein [Miltoncostaea marina]|uniref:VOC family protein n=1 Tax=Miltoncostaea marina TaxID=2843215 RepID=UPI001C3DFC06|nr:VOC family protein [Miltoncostaea marina]